MFVFGYSFVREENVIIQTDYQTFGITHFDSAVCITLLIVKNIVLNE